MPPRRGDRLKDITGMKSGRLTVTGFAEYLFRSGRYRPYWNCICSCGKATIVDGDRIKKGTTQSCGCLQRETRVKNGKKNHIDLVGKNIFEWYVKERVEDRISKNGIHAVQYLCVCSCGKERIVLANTLLYGQSHDCGHSRREKLSKMLLDDITGQTFGELTAQYRIGNEYPTKWHCLCSCGKEIDTYQGSLKSGCTLSCGHLSMSHGEYYIYDFLKESNIDFLYNRTFPELVNSTGGKLRLDFQILKDNSIACIIEYQGDQHYIEPKTNNPFWKDFGKQQREATDNIKRKFFTEKKIPFYEIRFSKRKNIVIKQLMEILIKHDLIHGNTVLSSQETA